MERLVDTPARCSILDMGCASCGAAREIGVLCRACALAVAPCAGLIPDHLCATIDAFAAEAWLIDGFGGAHPLATRSMIGRDLGNGLLVLARSVSREHAEIQRTAAGWTARDVGSRNGTFVDGVRATDEIALPPRAVLKLGEVALWFVSQRFHEPPPRASMTTGGATSGLVCYRIMHRSAELCVLAADDATAGGAVLWRKPGSEPWSERGLAPLEFQLLRTLCAHARAEAASPSRVRGCVSTEQLVRELPFQSRYANQDNVRQIVMRLRSVLADVGARGVLAVAPRRGYYLACQVSAAG
jgi:hypothetical protein